MENQTLPIWKTVRFVLNNLFSNKITYVRNAAFLQFFVSFVGFRILSTLFKGIIILSGQSNFNFSNMKLFFLFPHYYFSVYCVFIRRYFICFY